MESPLREGLPLWVDRLDRSESEEAPILNSSPSALMRWRPANPPVFASLSLGALG